MLDLCDQILFVLISCKFSFKEIQGGGITHVGAVCMLSIQRERFSPIAKFEFARINQMGDNTKVGEGSACIR